MTATCKYGVTFVRCEAPATTKRFRPSSETELWNVCDYHAAVLDRLRASIRDHAELLEKLRDS